MTARPASGEPAPAETRRSGLATDVFASGRVVDMILGLTVLEAGALGMHHRRTGRGIAPADLAGNLLAGIGLLLALLLTA